MLDLTDAAYCCGCTACTAVCQKNCIEMQFCANGFMYPSLNSRECINCHACEKVCPILNKSDFDSDTAYIYACQNKDEDIRKKSTSGGLFSVIAEAIIQKGGIVWAAGFDESLTVIHKEACSVSELDGMWGSKYVQSDLRGAFKNITEKLKKGFTVLFAGTPCQIEGLLNCVPEKLQSALYTLDFVCYGVPSPILYKRWIETIIKKHKIKVININFRDKKYGYSGVNCRLVLENGTVLEDKLETKSFLKTMFSKICLRMSCYDCFCRGKAKRSDFTLGDMWDVGLYSKEMDDDKGTTRVQINTEKGKQLFDSLNNIVKFRIGKLYGKDLEEQRKSEKRITLKHKKYDEFVRDIDKLDYDELIYKYLPPTKKEIIGCIFKPILGKMPFSKYFFRWLKRKKIAKSKK